jgi:hypothetical protein
MKALFINMKELKANTVLGGNIDEDKLIQFVNIAQDIRIQDFLGTKLYKRLMEGVKNEDLNNDEKALLKDYIKPMLVHYAAAEAIPFLSYTFGNGGIYKHGSETSESVDKSEIDFLVQKERNIAEHYTERFIAFMDYNSNLFPEYEDNEDDDIRPRQNADNTGWTL